MVQFNRSNSDYYPIGYPGIDFATPRSSEETAQLQGDLYYRSKIFPDLLGSVKTCKTGMMPYSQLGLDAYQAWTEGGWKTPHATFDSVERFDKKAHEEAREVDDALEEFWVTRDRTHLIEELGDYLWVASAFASNGSVVISDAIKQRLYAYAVGTKVRTDTGFQEPEWYDAATNLATKRGSVTLGDLDNLIGAGFVPRFSPIMNLYEEEEICCTTFAFDFQAFAAFMTSFANRQYSYGEAEYVSREDFDEYSENIGNLVTEVYFRVAAMAHFVGGSIADVAQVNIDKVSKRIATRTIDKTDGERPNELK